MRAWIPLSLFAILLIVIAFAACRRPSPRHTLMFDLVAHLAQETGGGQDAVLAPDNGEEAHVAIGTAAGRSNHHRRS